MKRQNSTRAIFLFAAYSHVFCAV